MSSAVLTLPMPKAPDFSTLGAGERADDPYSRPIAVAIDVDEEIQQLGIGNLFSLVTFKGGEPVLGAAGNTALLTLRYAPTLLVAVLTSDPHSKRTTDFLAWLERHGAGTPSVLLCEHGEAETALMRLAAQFRSFLENANAQRLEAVQETSRFQAANRELEYRFRIAEAALHRGGAARQKLAFANEPAPGGAQLLHLAAGEGAVTQILPLPSSGLSAVGIHLAGNGGAACELDARLVSLEDQTVHARWLVRGDRLKAGWNLLGLIRAPFGPARTMQLSLACKGAEGTLPGISLGPPQPIPTFQIWSAGGGAPVMTNSLALQIWQDIQGTAPLHDLETHLPLRGARRGGFVERALRPDTLSRIEHANPQDVRFDFPAVAAPQGEGSVLCHPPSHGFTLACMAGCVPPETLRVSASVFIGHRNSKDIDFGIVLAADSARARDIANGGTALMKHEGFSGWCKVGHGEARRLSAFREPGGDAPGSLFVATRMSRPGDNSHAWARFRDFSMMVNAR